jgi:hypothetical protein
MSPPTSRLSSAAESEAPLRADLDINTIFSQPSDFANFFICFSVGSVLHDRSSTAYVSSQHPLQFKILGTAVMHNFNCSSLLGAIAHDWFFPVLLQVYWFFHIILSVLSTRKRENFQKLPNKRDDFKPTQLQWTGCYPTTYFIAITLKLPATFNEYPVNKAQDTSIICFSR